PTFWNLVPKLRLGTRENNLVPSQNSCRQAATSGHFLEDRARPQSALVPKLCLGTQCSETLFRGRLAPSGNRVPESEVPKRSLGTRFAGAALRILLHHPATCFTISDISDPTLDALGACRRWQTQGPSRTGSRNFRRAIRPPPSSFGNAISSGWWVLPAKGSR